MVDAGYAVVALDDVPWTRHGGGTAWTSLTGPLGATETDVDVVRLGEDATVDLAVEPEQLLVPLDGSVALDDLSPEAGHRSVALVPGGVASRLRSKGPATVLVVSVPTEADPDTASVVIDLETARFTVPETSDVATAFLTGPLRSVGMKVNARRLEPGQAVPYHTEGTQEELFVPVEGPASLRVDDGTYPLPVGSVARVAPEVPRSAVNDGDADALWVMVGAPPTGGPTDWDPGAETLE